MANQPDIKKVQRAIRVPRELDAKVTKRFRMEQMSVKDAYILALTFATKDVTLTRADYKRIQDEIRKAQNAKLK